MKTCTQHITGDKGQPGGRQEQRWGSRGNATDAMR